jgi:hypothetical protein
MRFVDFLGEKAKAERRPERDVILDNHRHLYVSFSSTKTMFNSHYQDDHGGHPGGGFGGAGKLIPS